MQARGLLSVAFLAFFILLTPARADWREETGTFRIGMIAPYGGDHQVEGVDLMKRVYEGVLGLPVDVFVARNYAALVEAQTSGRIEYAIHSTLSYAAAQALCGCLTPLAVPTSISGATGIEAVLIRRRDTSSSPTSSQKPVAAPPPYALASAIVLAEIAAALGAENKVRHAGSAEMAEQEFLAGDAGGLIGWAPATRDGPVDGGGTMARLEEAGADVDMLEVTWRSGFLPFGPHAVVMDLDSEAVRLLQTFLLSLKDRNPDLYDVLESNRDGGFSAVTEADYRLAEKVARYLAGN